MKNNIDFDLNGAVRCKYCNQYIMFLKNKKGKFYAVDTAVLEHKLVVMRGEKTKFPRWHECQKRKD